jgi:hypothetical protein
VRPVEAPKSKDPWVLFRAAMMATPAKSKLLDTWCEMLGGLDRMRDYFHEFILSALSARKFWLNNQIPDLTDFNTMRTSVEEHIQDSRRYVTSALSKTNHGPKGRGFASPSGIKEMLMLFEMATGRFHSVSGELAMWISRDDDKDIIAITRLIHQGTPVNLIPLSMSHDIDSSLLSSML